MKRLAKWRLMSLLTALALILSGCGEPYLSALRPAGEVAEKQYWLMKLSTGIMVFVILVVTVIFIIVLLRFRRKSDNEIPKQVEGNHMMEIIWTTIPIFLLLILAVPTVTATFDLADVSPMDKKNKDGSRDALVVNVRASLYWWEFEYPDQKIVTSQELVVPTDEKVYFNLKGADVKHSFWIPPAGGKMDTNTDTLNRMWLVFDSKKAEEAGNVFYGKCAELCGPSHALMDFKVKPVSRDDFNKWVKDMQSVKEPAKAETADAQAGQETFNNSCISCHAVTPENSTPEAARVGPNLTNFGERDYVAGILKNDDKNVKNWIKEPDKYKPGTKMPGFSHLSEEQLDQVAAYLKGLKVQE